MLAARRGDLEEVQRIDAWLAEGVNVRTIPNRLFNRACIATILGDHNRAINLLREALDMGLDTEIPHNSLTIMLLRDNPQYRNLVKPKS